MADALVVSMTLEQEGAYRRLMDVCWLERGLPNDLEQLWRLAKAPSRDRFARQIWPLVGRKFQLRKDKLQHRRLDRERAKQAKNRRKKQLAANKRWHPDEYTRNAHASRVQCPSSSSSTTSADQKIKSTDAARRPVENQAVENRTGPDPGTFALYAVIAKEARKTSNREDGTDGIANIAAIFKDLCAKRQIAYDGDIAAAAIASVLGADDARWSVSR